MDTWTKTNEITSIPGMEVRTFRIQGITPLLCNNPASMLVSNRTRPGERIPKPEEEAESKVYRDEVGQFAFPGDAIRHAVVRAASVYRAGKQSLRSYIAHIMVVPVLVPILDPVTWQPVSGYALDIRRAVVQKQGVLRARPRFARWAMEFSILVDPSLVPVPKAMGSIDELLLHLLADAGQRVGLGDYRPDKGGPFGRFQPLRQG